MISSNIVCHSISNAINLYTVQIKAPKFLDAEFEKHRMISSNGSSDRAIPFLKALDNGYYLPDDIRLNQPGMQGDLLLDEDSKEAFWNDLKGIYGYTANVLKHWDKVHKQHLNRYLMGFAWQNKIATATEWDNFFHLRIDKASDPAMQQLAICMKQAMDESKPEELKHGEWHLSYISESVSKRLHFQGEEALKVAIKCSAARCARVSYMNHDNTEPDLHKDRLLADTLLAAGHMSPFEHQATPMKDHSYPYWQEGVTHTDYKGNLWSANFRGWIQYRQLIQMEK